MDVQGQPTDYLSTVLQKGEESMGDPKRKSDAKPLKYEEKTSLTYLDWNNQIAKHFFNPDKAGSRIWFSVERELIKDISKTNNSSFEDFIIAVKKGPDWVHRDQQKVCIKAYYAFKKWNRRSEYPPYIAYLALFVLAVNHGNSEDFSENAYYGRLRAMLKEDPVMGQYPSFQKMWELWIDLEKWSLEDKKGELGEFHFDIYGKNNHVGIPYYQVVLKKEDQKQLPGIFRKMGWDSDSNPTEEEVLIALRNNQNFLSNRTSKRITKGRNDFLSVLTDRILEELKEGDEEAIEKKQDETSNKRGFIDLCLDEINGLTKKADFSFRCRRKKGLPDEDFILKSIDSEWKVSVSSSIISGKIENFNIVDWEKDFSANFELSPHLEKEKKQPTKYQFSYRGEKYKIFIPAEKFGISGWISGQRYISNNLFYLAAHKSLSDKIQRWGEKECTEYQKLNFTGLPQNWHLFKIKGVNGDKLIKDTIPALSIDKKSRIQFEGGIRFSKGNRFFSFAPPEISVVGGKENTSLSLFYSIGSKKRRPLSRSSENGCIFSFPRNISLDAWITISTGESDSNQQKTEAKFILSKNRLSQFSDYLEGLKIDCFGNFSSEETTSETPVVSNKPSIQGAYGLSLESRENYPRLLNFSLLNAKKTYLIGNVPGQIVTLPVESWPISWIPIWRIQFRTYKRAAAHFLGIQEISSFQKDNKQVFLKDKIKLWKKIVWYRRKRIRTKKKHKQNWKLFLKKVRNV